MQNPSLIFSLASSAARSNAPSLVSRFKAARALVRQRQALAHLDNARLADLGLTRADVAAELNRSAWDVPKHWRT
jgi:uncharacterized protein YjiS (DUF1127 family)